jgi:hypothetical protein
MGKVRGGAPARFFEKILPQKAENLPAFLPSGGDWAIMKEKRPVGLRRMPGEKADDGWICKGIF